MVSRILWSTVLLAAFGLQIGCTDAQMQGWVYPSVRDVKDFADQERKEHTEQNEAITKQFSVLSPENEAKFNSIQAAFEKKMAEIGTQTNAIRGSVAENLGNIKAAALGVATRFTGVGLVTDAINNRVGEINVKTVAAQKERAATAKALLEAQTNLDRMTKDIAKAEKNLDSFTEGTEKKLLAASTETVSRLDKLRDDGTKFRAELAKSLNLSVNELKELDGMSTNEIMSILGLGGAAAGVGVAGGRTGKSRSHVELEKMKATIAKLLADLERQKPPLA